MKASIWAKIFMCATAAMTLAACGGANHSGDSGKDVTKRFLRTMGDQGYSSDSDPTTMMMISNDGSFRTIHLGDCSYYVASTILSVTANSNKTYSIQYVNVGAGLIGPSVNDEKCTKFISDFKNAHVPEKNIMSACNYSRKGMELSCGENKPGSAKWKAWN